MLYYKGDYVEKNLKSKRINKFDPLGSVRKKGYGSLDEVEIFILESDGSFSVLKRSDNVQILTFQDMMNMEEKKLD